MQLMNSFVEFYLEQFFIVKFKVVIKDLFDFDFMYIILFNSYVLYVFFFGENMCEIIYKIKEYVYFLIVYFYIEKR